jgi:hypothetical protein
VTPEPDPVADRCSGLPDPDGALAAPDPAELEGRFDGELTARPITTAWRTSAAASARPSNVRERVESRRPDGDGSGGDSVSGSERSMVSKVSLIALFAAWCVSVSRAPTWIFYVNSLRVVARRPPDDDERTGPDDGWWTLTVDQPRAVHSLECCLPGARAGGSIVRRTRRRGGMIPPLLQLRPFPWLVLRQEP